MQLGSGRILRDNVNNSQTDNKQNWVIKPAHTWSGRIPSALSLSIAIRQWQLLLQKTPEIKNDEQNYTEHEHQEQIIKTKVLG
jgi:hypothetical protein